MSAERDLIDSKELQRPQTAAATFHREHILGSLQELRALTKSHQGSSTIDLPPADQVINSAGLAHTRWRTFSGFGLNRTETLANPNTSMVAFIAEPEAQQSRSGTEVAPPSVEPHVREKENLPSELPIQGTTWRQSVDGSLLLSKVRRMTEMYMNGNYDEASEFAKKEFLKKNPNGTAADVNQRRVEFDQDKYNAAPNKAQFMRDFITEVTGKAVIQQTESGAQVFVGQPIVKIDGVKIDMLTGEAVIPEGTRKTAAHLKAEEAYKKLELSIPELAGDRLRAAQTLVLMEKGLQLQQAGLGDKAVSPSYVEFEAKNADKTGDKKSEPYDGKSRSEASRQRELICSLYDAGWPLEVLEHHFAPLDSGADDSRKQVFDFLTDKALSVVPDDVARGVLKDVLAHSKPALKDALLSNLSEMAKNPADLLARVEALEKMTKIFNGESGAYGVHEVTQFLKEMATSKVLSDPAVHAYLAKSLETASFDMTTVDAAERTRLLTELKDSIAKLSVPQAEKDALISELRSNLDKPKANAASTAHTTDLHGLDVFDDFHRRHALERGRLDKWKDKISAAKFSNFHDVQAQFGQASQIPNDANKGGKSVIFNIGDNCRLHAKVDFATGSVTVERIMTHQEYDMWMKTGYSGIERGSAPKPAKGGAGSTETPDPKPTEGKPTEPNSGESVKRPRPERVAPTAGSLQNSTTEIGKDGTVTRGSTTDIAQRKSIEQSELDNLKREAREKAKSEKESERAQAAELKKTIDALESTDPKIRETANKIFMDAARNELGRSEGGGIVNLKNGLMGIAILSAAGLACAAMLRKRQAEPPIERAK